MYDELLMWCSERGSGTLDAFRETYEWLAADHPDSSVVDWRIALYNLQALGHAEVDWEDRLWGVTPPVLTTLTNGGGHALFVGQRPIWLLQRLEQLSNDPDTVVSRLSQSVLLQPPIDQVDGPSVRLVTAANPEDGRDLCNAIGIGFEDRAADQLAARLPRLQEMLNERGELRGPGGLEPQRMSEGGGDIWTDVDGPGEPPLHGAFRYQRYNTHRYVYWVGMRGFIAEKRAVIYAELARTHRWVLRYDAPHRELYTPIRMQLPHLHARAAVLHSGLLPQVSRLCPLTIPSSSRPNSDRRNFVKYVNIDEPFAKLVADSLYQELQYVH